MTDIITSTITEDFTSLVSDNTEIALDLLLDEGVLKELPIFGSVISLFKIGRTISDRLFLNNLLHFIYQLKDIPTDRKNEMIDKIEESSKHRTKVGNFLTSILIKTESTKKADFLGFLFGKYILEEIDQEIF